MGLPRSKWANPYRITADRSREEALVLYERFLGDSGFVGQVAELKGKTLLCHCVPGLRCHGDILVEHADRKGDD